MATSVSLNWRMRDAFWSRWHPFRFSLNKPQTIGPPETSTEKITEIPIGEIYSRIPLKEVLAFEQLPDDESELGMRAFVNVGLLLNRVIPPMQKGLPGIDEDIGEALDHGVPGRYRRRLRAPVLPEIYEGVGAPDLADLAATSPFAVLLERGEDGDLMWDLRTLGHFEHHEGLRSLGLRVVFDEPDVDGRIAATEIHSDEYGRVVVGSPQWQDSKDLAVCAATTYLALVRHHIGVHLVGGDHWAVAARNHLPSDHPLFRLLWPFIFNSLYTNYGTTRVQLLPEGDFANVYSFTHQGLMGLYDEMYPLYDARVTDPDADWERRRLSGLDFDCPVHDNLRELFSVINDHTRRYVDAYFDSDDQLRSDEDVASWLRGLDGLVPNGIGGLLGDTVTRAGVARLIAGHGYEGSTVHDLVGTTLWDYQLWADRNPSRVYRDGSRVPVDVFQRMINNNFALQIRRAPMLADYGAVALDDRGAALFGQFFRDCTALQDRYDKSPAGPWRMEPRNLEINMNA